MDGKAPGMAAASSAALPTDQAHHSVATLLLAMADPQPNVLKHESTMFPSSSTQIWSFITSPHAGAPTRPVPTLLSLLVEAAHVAGLLVVVHYLQ